MRDSEHVGQKEQERVKKGKPEKSGKRRALFGVVIVALVLFFALFYIKKQSSAERESAKETTAAAAAEESGDSTQEAAGESPVGESGENAGKSAGVSAAKGSGESEQTPFAGDSGENVQEQSAGDLKPDDFFRTGYEVFVYSFCDSDGDRIGDLPGLFSKLEYLNDGQPGAGDDLGVTGLWLMPVFPSPTYHKYDVTDFMNIDPAYGTLQDLENLLGACHARGMTVILDLPVNHTSTAHPWFQKAAEYLRGLPAGRDAVKEECPYVWYYHFAREQYDGYVPLADSDWYYEARFWSEMPDLNLTTEEVRQELEKVTDFWLDRGVDGFRLDAVTSYYTDNRQAGIDFTGWLTDTVKKKNPSAYLVGEAWTDQNSYAEFYRSGIDSMFDFAFAGQDGMIARVVKGNESVSAFVQAMTQEEKLYSSLNPAAVNAPFYTNHDMDRSTAYYEGDDGSRAKIAQALNLLMTGNAFLYYGEELGMAGCGKDDNRRAPMFWSEDPQAAGMCAGPPGMDAFSMPYGALETQKNDPDSIFSYVREAVRIRESLPVIARGRTEPIPELSEERFCGFYRVSDQADQADLSDSGGVSDVSNASGLSDAADVSDVSNASGLSDTSGVSGEQEKVLILINTGDTAVTRQLSGEAAEYGNLCAALYTGQERAVLNGAEVTIPARGIVFLQK